MAIGKVPRTTPLELTQSAVTSWLDLTLHSVNLTANPGYPFCTRYPTKQTMLDELGLDYIGCLVYRRLTALMRYVGPTDAFSLIKADLRDPIRVFTKNELHLISKLAALRDRQICSVSFVDELVERWFFGDLDKHMKERARADPDYPFQIAMGFDAVHSNVFATAQARKGWWLSDVSNMDFSIGSNLSCLTSCVLLLCLKDEYHHGRALVLRALYNKVYYVQDGTFYCQSKMGITCSGSAITTILNTVARVCARYIVAGDLHIVATGDNAYESSLDLFVDDYKRLFDLELKDVEKVPRNAQCFEYCSHQYEKHDTGWRCYPVRLTKAIVTLFGKHPRTPANFMATAVEFQDHPKAHWLLTEIGPRYLGANP